jgi:hypothetical protein
VALGAFDLRHLEVTDSERIPTVALEAPVHRILEIGKDCGWGCSTVWEYRKAAHHGHLLYFYVLHDRPGWPLFRGVLDVSASAGESCFDAFIGEASARDVCGTVVVMSKRRATFRGAKVSTR